MNAKGFFFLNYLYKISSTPYKAFDIGFRQNAEMKKIKATKFMLWSSLGLATQEQIPGRGGNQNAGKQLDLHIKYENTLCRVAY